MAILALVSDQLTNAAAKPVVMNRTIDMLGKLRFAYFSKTGVAAGDDGTNCDLVLLPKGNIRVLGALSRVAFSAFGASRVLDLGHRAYDKIDGVSEAVALAAFDNDIDISAAGAAAIGNALSYEDSYVLTSKNGVMVCALVTGGTWPIGGIIRGYIAFLAD